MRPFLTYRSPTSSSRRAGRNSCTWRPPAKPAPPPLRPPQESSESVPELPVASPGAAGRGGLEWWIGNRIGWLAVIVFVFAAAFFLKYAFDNNWINEWGRVCIGLVIGGALCVGGFGLHRRGGYVLRDVCTAAGVATLYLSTYATFSFFDPVLLTPDHGGALLNITIVLATVLAFAYDSAPVALLTLTGAACSRRCCWPAPWTATSASSSTCRASPPPRSV